MLHGAGNIGSNAGERSGSRATVVLTATKFGQSGGNATRAQFVNPGVANSPLMVSVTPNFGGQKDVNVTLATDAAGKLTSTAAQVVAAINADPAASARDVGADVGVERGCGHRPAARARQPVRLPERSRERPARSVPGEGPPDRQAP